MRLTREDLQTARTERQMIAHLIAELVADGQPVTAELVRRYRSSKERYEDLWEQFMTPDTPTDP